MIFQPECTAPTVVTRIANRIENAYDDGVPILCASCSRIAEKEG